MDLFSTAGECNPGNCSTKNFQCISADNTQNSVSFFCLDHLRWHCQVDPYLSRLDFFGLHHHRSITCLDCSYCLSSLNICMYFMKICSVQDKRSRNFCMHTNFFVFSLKETRYQPPKEDSCECTGLPSIVWRTIDSEIKNCVQEWTRFPLSDAQSIWSRISTRSYVIFISHKN